MFSNTIVVSLDGSEFAAQALPVARAFVHQTGVRMLLMSTRWDDDMNSARSYLDEVGAAHQDADVSTIVIADRPATVIHPLDAAGPDAVLDAIVERIRAQGLPAHRYVLRSTYAAGAIDDFAETVDADLVAMDSHARAGTARVALGSVTMGVVGMARCPVLVNRTA